MMRLTLARAVGPANAGRHLVAIAVLAAALCSQPAAQTSSDATLAISGAANQTPWVAAHGNLVAVVWGASASAKADVFSAVSRDGGKTFATPVRVNAVMGEARVSGEIAPRVALVPRQASADPEIVVLWNAKDGTTQIKVARSRDGGRSFGPAEALQAAGAVGERGWQSLTVDSRGNAHAIWLDHRGMASGAAKTGEHKGEHDGVAMAQRSGLYYASSAGGAASERELFKGVCYCCKTAMATAPDGTLYAAWRHVFAGNFRDMGFTSSRDGGKSFSPLLRVNQDGWSINGCPDDGPAMVVDGKGAVHLVWPTVSGGTEGALLYAVSRDGRSFSAPVRVPTLGSPKPSHPQIALDSQGRIAVAWDEVRNGVRGAAFSRMTSAAGAPPAFGAIQTLGTGGPSAYPVLAAAEKGLVAVWTSGAPANATIKVRVIEPDQISRSRISGGGISQAFAVPASRTRIAATTR